MKTAIYKMSNNHYLGDCIAVIAELDEKEKPASFTRGEVVLYIKTSKDSYEKIHTVDDLRRINLFDEELPLLRIGSECMLGVFGDSHCNCEEERIEALKMIGRKSGIYIHMPQEAQGQGLFYKVQELNLQVNGLMPDGSYVGEKSQSEAAEILLGDSVIDIRDYDFTAMLLKELGLAKYEFAFMSRNINKVRNFKAAGIRIGAMAEAVTNMTAENMAETLVKWVEKGFCFTKDEAEQIIALLMGNEVLPERAQKLIYKAALMYQTEEGCYKLEHRSHLPLEMKEELKNAICHYSNIETTKVA